MSSEDEVLDQSQLVPGGEHLSGHVTIFNLDFDPLFPGYTSPQQTPALTNNDDHDLLYEENTRASAFDHTIDPSNFLTADGFNIVGLDARDILGYNVFTFQESASLVQHWKSMPINESVWSTAQGLSILEDRNQIVTSKMLICDPTRIAWEAENRRYLLAGQTSIYNQQHLREAMGYQDEVANEWQHQVSAAWTQSTDGCQAISVPFTTPVVQNEVRPTVTRVSTKKRGRPIKLTGDPKIDARRKKARESQRHTRATQKERIAAGLPAKTRGPSAWRIRDQVGQLRSQQLQSIVLLWI